MEISRLADRSPRLDPRERNTEWVMRYEDYMPNCETYSKGHESIETRKMNHNSEIDFSITWTHSAGLRVEKETAFTGPLFCLSIITTLGCSRKFREAR